MHISGSPKIHHLDKKILILKCQFDEILIINVETKTTI